MLKSIIFTEESISWHRSARKLCALTCVNNVDQKDITLSRLCYYLSESTRGTNNKTMFFSPYIYIYIYIVAKTKEFTKIKCSMS